MVVALAPAVSLGVGALVSPSPTTVMAVTVLRCPLGSVIVLREVLVDRVVGPVVPPAVPVPVPAKVEPPLEEEDEEFPTLVPPDGEDWAVLVFVVWPGRVPVVEVMNVPDDVTEVLCDDVPVAATVVSVPVGRDDSVPVVPVELGVELPPPEVMGGKGRMLTSPVRFSSVEEDVLPAAGGDSVVVGDVCPGDVPAGDVVSDGGGGFSVGEVPAGGGGELPAGELSTGGDCGDGDSTGGVLPGLLSAGGRGTVGSDAVV